MTSKEALERLKDDIEINYLSTKHSNEKDRSNYLILLNSIEKDLEILDILKNNLYEEKGTGRFKGCNTINCSLGNQHSGIDYTKVKEWLENGQ